MALNQTNEAIDALLVPGAKISLRASAPTDIWRKPPNHDVFNAPTITKSIPISSFSSVRVSATGEWSTLYDQGGLVIVLPPKKSGTQKRWIKTGIEFYQGKPCMSVVAADEWADWSLLPLSPDDEREGKMTVEIEREVEDGEFNSVLRVFLIDGKGSKTQIRDVTWGFHGFEEGDEMLVGVFAAKPTKDSREELVVHFEGFEIQYRD